jgi:hypothetical protein
MPVVPFLKVTVPVGVFGPNETTCAVNVTAWPCVDGFRLEPRLVVVAYLFTVCLSLPPLAR